MPIFTQTLQRINPENPQEAVKKMANHIKYIQEQLEYTLINLDSRNITEIDTDKTVVGDSQGSLSVGSLFQMSGSNGESFTVGKDSSGQFVFSINGANGTQTLFLDNDGKLIITKNASLTIDGGEW